MSLVGDVYINHGDLTTVKPLSTCLPIAASETASPAVLTETSPPDVALRIRSRLFVMFIAAVVLIRAAQNIMIGGAAALEANRSNSHMADQTESTIVSRFLFALPLCLASLLIAVNAIAAPRAVEFCLRTRWLWITLAFSWGIQSARSFAAAPMSLTNIKLAMALFYLVTVYTTYRAGITYRTVYTAFRFCAWTMSWAALAFLVVAPHLVVTYYDALLLPGVPFRLHGFFNANDTALFLGIYLSLPRPERMSAAKFGTPVKIMDLVCLACLVLTQSKTMLILFALSFAIRTAVRVYLSSGTIIRCGVVLLGAAVMGICLSETVIEYAMRTVSSASNVSITSLESMSGRKIIWEQMLRDWEACPFFGYGVTTWHTSGLGTVRSGTWIATNGHSLFVQTLWESGLVGLLFLVLHIVTLTYCTFKVNAAMRPALVGAMLAFLCRSYTEVTIPLYNWNKPPIFVYLLLILIVGILSHQESPANDGLASDAAARRPTRI